MNPTTFVPTPDAIPVAWGWLKFFLMLTFMLHILFMNVMVGTGMIALFSNLRRDPGPETLAVEKDISRKLTFIIAFTVNMGVAPLLFLQAIYGHFMYVSSILMAVYWLSLFVLLIVAYYSAYYYKFSFEKSASTSVWYIGTAVAIFLFIGFVFSNNMTLMLRPGEWGRYFENPHGTLLNLSDPTLLPRFLHFMTASAAIGGLFVAILWTLGQKKGAPEAKANIELGMRWFSFGTMIQFAVGAWFLASLPKEIMGIFTGGSALHTAIFLVSMALAIGALLFGIYQKVWEATASTLVLVSLMIVMRDMVRTLCLKPFFEIAELSVIPQYSPMVLFMLSLLAGIVVIVYVLRLATRTQTPNTQTLKHQNTP